VTVIKIREIDHVLLRAGASMIDLAAVDGPSGLRGSANAPPA